MNTDKIIAEKIASEYAPKKTSKVVALKKLDRKAKRSAEVFAYTFGIISSLVMGTGMSFAMGVIGGNTIISMVVGIIIGCIGILGVSINYLLGKDEEKEDDKQYTIPESINTFEEARDFLKSLNLYAYGGIDLNQKSESDIITLELYSIDIKGVIPPF